MKSNWLTHLDDPTCIGMLLLWDSTILLPSAKSYTFAIKCSLIRTFPLFKSRWICNAIDDIQSNPNPLFPVLKNKCFLISMKIFQRTKKWMNEWYFEEWQRNDEEYWLREKKKDQTNHGKGNDFLKKEDQRDLLSPWMQWWSQGSIIQHTPTKFKFHLVWPRFLFREWIDLIFSPFFRFSSLLLLFSLLEWECERER